MYRLLLIDLEGLLSADSSATHASTPPWLSWLSALLRQFDDVRIVLDSTKERTDAGPSRELLGDLSTRVIGSTHGYSPRLDALEAAIRFNKGRVDHHLLVVADNKGLPSGRFNVLVCDTGLGLSAPKAQAALAAWLVSSAPPPGYLPRSKPPRGVGRPVLYLDFDGVLHHENVLWHPRRGAYAGPPGFTLFEHAALLDELLAPFPEVGIVLSTSWVRTYGCYGAAKRLPPGLHNRVLGATFHSQMNEESFVARPRGQQVLADVARRRPLDWLALDDTDEGWPPEVRDRVLITDERLGIAAPGMPERVAAALKQLFASKAP